MKMKKRNVSEVIILKAWNPKREQMEKLPIKCNTPYKVVMNDGTVEYYIFDSSAKAQKALNKHIDPENPSFLLYQYKWNDTDERWDYGFDVLLIDDITSITEVMMRCVKDTTTQDRMYSYSINDGGATISISRPVRILTKNNKGVKTSYNAVINKYVQRKAFGMGHYFIVDIFDCGDGYDYICKDVKIYLDDIYNIYNISVNFVHV